MFRTSNDGYFIGNETLHSLCVKKVREISDRRLGLRCGHCLLKGLLVVEPHFRESIVGGSAPRPG
jgi:hypothetical protein